MRNYITTTLIYARTPGVAPCEIEIFVIRKSARVSLFPGAFLRVSSEFWELRCIRRLRWLTILKTHYFGGIQIPF